MGASGQYVLIVEDIDHQVAEDGGYDTYEEEVGRDQLFSMQQGPVEDELPNIDEICCEVCGSGDNEESLLLCDGCMSGWHLECLSPPLAVVPEGDWFCTMCAKVIRDTPMEAESSSAVSSQEAGVRTGGENESADESESDAAVDVDVECESDTEDEEERKRSFAAPELHSAAAQQQPVGPSRKGRKRPRVKPDSANSDAHSPSNDAATSKKKAKRPRTDVGRIEPSSTPPAIAGSSLPVASNSSLAALKRFGSADAREREGGNEQSAGIAAAPRAKQLDPMQRIENLGRVKSANDVADLEDIAAAVHPQRDGWEQCGRVVHAAIVEDPRLLQRLARSKVVDTLLRWVESPPPLDKARDVATFMSRLPLSAVDIIRMRVAGRLRSVADVLHEDKDAMERFRAMRRRWRSAVQTHHERTGSAAKVALQTPSLPPSVRAAAPTGLQTSRPQPLQRTDSLSPPLHARNPPSHTQLSPLEKLSAGKDARDGGTAPAERPKSVAFPGSRSGPVARFALGSTASATPSSSGTASPAPSKPQHGPLRSALRKTGTPAADTLTLPSPSSSLIRSTSSDSSSPSTSASVRIVDCKRLLSSPTMSVLVGDKTTLLTLDGTDLKMFPSRVHVVGSSALEDVNMWLNERVDDRLRSATAARVSDTSALGVLLKRAQLRHQQRAEEGEAAAVGVPRTICIVAVDATNAHVVWMYESQQQSRIECGVQPHPGTLPGPTTSLAALMGAATSVTGDKNERCMSGVHVWDPVGLLSPSLATTLQELGAVVDKTEPATDVVEHAAALFALVTAEFLSKKMCFTDVFTRLKRAASVVFTSDLVFLHRSIRDKRLRYPSTKYILYPGGGVFILDVGSFGDVESDARSSALAVAKCIRSRGPRWKARVVQAARDHPCVALLQDTLTEQFDIMNAEEESSSGKIVRTTIKYLCSPGALHHYRHVILCSADETTLAEARAMHLPTCTPTNTAAVLAELPR